MHCKLLIRSKVYYHAIIIWQAELNEEIDDINRAKEEIVPGSDMDSDDDDDTSSTGLGGRVGSPTVRHLGGGSGRRVSHEEFNVWVHFVVLEVQYVVHPVCVMG